MLPIRFMEKVSIGHDGGCWLWVAYRLPNGYGRFSVDGSPVYAHRHAYEVLVGDIPDGLEVHHSCHKRPCVNPSHMELMDRSSHMRLTMREWRRKNPHCPQGHHLVGDAVRINNRGGRVCVACHREQNKRSRR